MFIQLTTKIPNIEFIKKKNNNQMKMSEILTKIQRKHITQTRKKI